MTDPAIKLAVCVTMAIASVASLSGLVSTLQAAPSPARVAAPVCSKPHLPAQDARAACAVERMQAAAGPEFKVTRYVLVASREK